MNKVSALGATLNEVLQHLDKSYPGIRFRMINEQDRVRAHIKIFINETLTEDLSTPVHANDRVHIICALSGG